MISYELPLVISSVTVVMMAGTLSLPKIVEAQGHHLWGWLPAWHGFTPWGLAGFILFVVAAVAESNRAPFDLPEAESEIIAGYFTEYSGFKFALFFLGEYLGMFAVSGLAITLFLGGWHSPFPGPQYFPSWGWFFIKLFGFIAFYIWLRGTLPRLRTDQLMNFAWKFLLPMTLFNVVVAGIWHFSAGWNLAGGVVGRWVLCGAMLAVPYVILGRTFERKLPRRVYRYAS
jgi:NADH-quinone oxidoreductase subunit H